LAIVGNPLDDEDLISYIIGGLNPSFNAFITSYSLSTHDKSMKFDDFRDLLLNHETLLQQQTSAVDSATFALFTNKPSGARNWLQRNKPPQHMKFSPRGSHSNFYPRQHSYSSVPRPTNFSPRHHSGHINTAMQSYSNKGPIPNVSNPVDNGNHFSRSSKPPCQICGKIGHQALDCFHRMDYSYQGKHPPPQLAAMAAQTNATFEDQPWFADSGANTHITNDLENLSIQQPFQFDDTVAVGNGAGLTIENIGSSTLQSSSNSPFHLNKVLHCPQATANLLSIQRFCLDNDCYFILTAHYFYVKDYQTHAVLLEGRSENGLYPLRL
jgi:hypothetical protein